MLAFDPERLALLGRSIDDTTDRMATLRTDDPFVVDAVRRLTMAADALRGWLPQLLQIRIVASVAPPAPRDIVGSFDVARLLAGGLGAGGLGVSGGRGPWLVVGSEDDPATDAVIEDLVARYPPADLARVVTSILALWHAPADAVPDADVLLGAVARSAGASRALLAHLMERPDGLLLLTDTVRDPAAATAVVLSATRPPCPVAEAGRIVTGWIGHVLHGVTNVRREIDAHWRHLLGAVVAPWLVQLTSRGDDWGLDARSSNDLLAEVMQDPAAMRSLLDARGAILGGLQGVTSLHEIAGVFGWLDSIAERDDLDSALAGRVVWDLGWLLVGKLVAQVLDTTSAGRVPGADLAVSASLHALRQEMEQQGWPRVPTTKEGVMRQGVKVALIAQVGLLGLALPGVGRAVDEGLDRVGLSDRDTRSAAPAPSEWTRGEIGRQHDLRRVHLGHAVAVVTLAALQRDGVVPFDVPPPPGADEDADCPSLSWRLDFESWVETTFTDIPTAGEAIMAAATAVLNRYQASEACFDLTQ